jgi:phage terminase large subunit-like protein
MDYWKTAIAKNNVISGQKQLLFEQLLKRKVKQDFLLFARLCLNWWRPYLFHRKLAEIIVTGKQNKIMIFAPPQHGKSTITSVLYPAWALGHDPTLRIILVSYSASLAEHFSFRIREIIHSEIYKGIFSTRIKKKRDTINYWETEDGGYLLASGVEGAMTGYSADLIIIDDPIENWAKASSPASRESIWLWYTTTLISRLQRNGKILLIMTRWHTDDLAARILAVEKDWVVYRFPAIAESKDEHAKNDEILRYNTIDPTNRQPGLPLVPELHDVEKLEELRKFRGFMSLYQGVPMPPEGTAFRRNQIKIVQDYKLLELRACRYWDKSSGVSSQTAGVLAGVTQTGDIIILDVTAGYWQAGEREQIILNKALEDSKQFSRYCVVIEQEPGSGGKDSADYTRQNLIKYGISTFVDRPVMNKNARFDLVCAYAQSGKLYAIRAPWLDMFLDNLVMMPVVARDIADATSGVIKYLSQSSVIVADNIFYA